MRLLNATSLKLEEFFDDSLPPYAILSHRWQDDEVSFQDMQTDAARQKAGYTKLKLCCDQAVKDGLGYAWVDTCCIDKSSSAGLSESINSMYRFYQGSAACYAYLFDVQNNRASFSMSAWFSRGWTLQELIAPARVKFYSSTWGNLGTKADFKNEISAITGIDIQVLEGVDPARFCIAKRMSWASRRKTTRIEDRAYSLLGIFDVNMPMLYGEGEKAFLRLQDEIMKHSDDNSLFAWSSTDDNYRGLLAKSPSCFSNCTNIVLSERKLNQVPYSTTNMGLKI
ncbi:Vegetative incompatibility protein HET-E-1 [Lachnellula cervina]|uniref:Vegetative incompatibility protein HET-E-1 n=1 Tax=Lachnellula cervina TaxID=1316786 RepID=A0A7D8YQP6_9HELO|nr:Vegetative incompatibility protein HET-E-1 [Lachnellula cervina]